MSHYKPYSQEWHRYRSLKESIDAYLDNYIDNSVILSDILNILSNRSEESFNDFKRINELEKMLNGSK